MNLVSLIGRLTKDPDLRYTDSQTPICTFTLAVDRPKKNGESQGADFIRIQAWGKTGENCGRYLAKGRQVAISGSIRTGSYKNRNGDTVYTTDVTARHVQFLGSGNSTGDSTNVQSKTQSPASPNNEKYNPYEHHRDPQMNMNDMPPAGFEAIDDDDIPF